MNSWSITLPFPPSLNGLFYNKKNGGRARTDKYVKWYKKADCLALTQKPFPTFTNRVDITIRLNGGRKTSDCDNLGKAPLDYIVNLEILKDDCKPYVRSTKQIWDDNIPRGFCEIFIEECE